MNDDVSIQLYNTKSRSIETFIPIVSGKVGIYSCGPTVYHYQHLGNMRAVLFADTLRRLFAYARYDVNHVINITDVGHLTSDGDDGDDKMEKGSAREGKSVWEIATFYTEDYFKCLDMLNIPRDKYSFPRATDTIDEQIALIKTLEEKRYTYKIQDGIYFDTAKFPAYPELAKLDIQGLQSGARVEENKEKRNGTDFALWKFSPQNEKRQMEWASPWGVGFPGWHIECSAMSKKYLGAHFDIHTGGIDHIPVHHTNEIAQSECANDETYVNYWMHVNFLNDTTGKMSKSKGDFLRLQSVIDKGISPLAYRYYLLTVHYRSEIAFSFESLEAASVSYKKLLTYIRTHIATQGIVHDEYKKNFLEALCNDIGTPAVIAGIWKMIKDEIVSDADTVATILDIDAVLGLDLYNQAQISDEQHIPEEIQALFDKRALARSQKDWATADSLRDEIIALGYEVKDK